ncbi:MAG TPA: AzlD domain-containing protein [Acidimicrobiia bacterium]|nr:AzlD domain-containing protein [Acidimicrobiia bacterium]
MGDLAAVVLVGAGTYLMRALFILALAKKRIPETVLIPLRYIGSAVLAALIVALLTDSDGKVSIGVPEVSGFLAGGVVAYRTRSQVWTLVAGMVVYWVVRSLF